MKNYICNSCSESFSIPEGTYSRVHCPFCDSTETALKSTAASVVVAPPVKVRHPLHWPMWIIANCCLFFTVLALIHIGAALLFFGAIVQGLSGVLAK